MAHLSRAKNCVDQLEVPQLILAAQYAFHKERLEENLSFKDFFFFFRIFIVQHSITEFFGL